MYNKQALSDLINLYSKVKPEIETRLNEFSELWKEGSEEDIYAELVFCIFTPQSKAKACWKTLETIRKNGLLVKGTEEEILEECNLVRFKYKKAGFAVASRKYFVNKDNVSIRPLLKEQGSQNGMRDWLVDNIKGMGWKEASHFLRNVGQGGELSILDRHILKNLVSLGVLDEIPKSMTRHKYMEVEEKMIAFSSSSKIPMDHLDMLLWYKEAGEVFK